MKNIRMYYRKDLDEMRICRRDSGKTLVYIQGYSNKYPMPEKDTLPLELLVWMAVSYPEIAEAI